MAGKIGEMFNRSMTTISAKSEAMAEISRNKTAMVNAQKIIDESVFVLGQRLYHDWKNGTVDLSTYKTDVERIMQVEHDMESFRRRIEEIKAQDTAPAVQTNNAGSFFCNSCGRQLPFGSRFCDGCGTQVG